jgi:hypothetical protein
MFKDSAYKGLIVGAAFSLGSYLSIFSFIIPIFSIMPGAFIEGIAKNLVDNHPYDNVGNATISILWLLLGTSLALFLFIIYLRSSKSQNISWKMLILMMCAEYFIIHALGFYIYWKQFLNFRGDGQLIFAAVDSFRYSSIGFLIAGALMDMVKNTFSANKKLSALKNNPEKDNE